MSSNLYVQSATATASAAADIIQTGPERAMTLPLDRIQAPFGAAGVAGAGRGLLHPRLVDLGLHPPAQLLRLHLRLADQRTGAIAQVGAELHAGPGGERQAGADSQRRSE